MFEKHLLENTVLTLQKLGQLGVPLKTNSQSKNSNKPWGILLEKCLLSHSLSHTISHNPICVLS